MVDREQIDIIIQSRNPWRKGLIPIVFRFFIERLVPIKNKLIWRPFFPTSLIILNPLYSGNFEFINIAIRKNRIKYGKEIFFSPPLYK